MKLQKMMVAATAVVAFIFMLTMGVPSALAGSIMVTTPDSGTTLTMLGGVLVGLAILRQRLRG